MTAAAAPRTGSGSAPASRTSPTAIAATRKPAEKSACATCMIRGPPEASTDEAATLMTTSSAPDVAPTSARARASCQTEPASPGRTTATPKRTSAGGSALGPTRSTTRPVRSIAGSAASPIASSAAPSSATEAPTCSFTSGRSTPQAPQKTPKAAKAASGPRLRGTLAGGFEEGDAGRYAHVQGLDLAGEGDGEGGVADTPHARPEAATLRAEDESRAGREVGRTDRRVRVAGGRPPPEVRSLDLLQVAREVDDDSDGEVLDRARRRLADRRRDAPGVVLGDDDAGGARALGAPADGAEVVRVGHLVEAGEQRTFARGELEGVRVAVGLAEGDDALVLHGAGRLVEGALADDLKPDPRRLPEPRLRLQRPLGDEQLQDLALARAQHLAHGAPPVDQLPRHGFGTSRKPPGTSWTSQPRPSISVRSASARAKSCSARAASRSSARRRTSSGASPVSSIPSPKTARPRTRSSRSPAERHACRIDSARGVEKSSSSAAAKSSQEGASSARSTTRKAVRKSSACARACRMASSEYSIGP